MSKNTSIELFPPPIDKKKKNGKKANELDGKTWLQYSISVWNDIRKTPEEARLGHPAMFPAQLPRRIMEMFLTKEEKKVLDPFLGSGSTLVAAAQLGKEGIGLEISSEYIITAKDRLMQLDYLVKHSDQKIFHDDARNLLNYVKPESIDFCITSPPYWDILAQKRSVDLKEVKDYKEAENNLGNIHDYAQFLKELKIIFDQVYSALKREAYCVVIVMDLRKKSKFYPYHMDITKIMEESGFVLDDIIIWDRRHEYNNLKPIGYPTTFRVNKIHEFILIFQKNNPAENN